MKIVAILVGALLSMGTPASAQATFQVAGSAKTHTLPECLNGVLGPQYPVNYADCAHSSYDSATVDALINGAVGPLATKTTGATANLQAQVDLLKENVRDLSSANDALTKRLNKLEAGGQGARQATRWVMPCLPSNTTSRCEKSRAGKNSSLQPTAVHFVRIFVTHDKDAAPH
jgi:hypothetical protein